MRCRAMMILPPPHGRSFRRMASPPRHSAPAKLPPADSRPETNHHESHNPCQAPRHLRSVIVPADRSAGDIRVLLDSIRRLAISEPIKKRMLVHALWEIAFATGNKQSSFFGRYRSEGVLRQAGLKIQRDHIYRKEKLIEQLLWPRQQISMRSLLKRNVVSVTEGRTRLAPSESTRKLDGWERYRIAGIAVYAIWPATCG